MSNKKNQAPQTISTCALLKHFKGAQLCISLDDELFDLKGIEHSVQRNLKTGDLFFLVDGKEFRVYDAAKRNFAKILDLSPKELNPPTFEEVRNHFKGAEKIVCLIGKKQVEVEQYQIQNYIYFRENAFFINQIMVWNKESGFATFYGGNDDEEIHHRCIVNDKGEIVFMYIGTKARMIEAHQEQLKEREQKIAALAKEARGIKNSRIERIRFPLTEPAITLTKKGIDKIIKKRNESELKAVQNLKEIIISQIFSKCEVIFLGMRSGKVALKKAVEEIEVNDPVEVKSISIESFKNAIHFKNKIISDILEEKRIREIEGEDPIEVNPENKILKAIIKNHFKNLDQQRVYPGPKEIVEVPSGIHTVQEVTNSSFIGFQNGKDKYYAVENNNAFSLTKPYQLKLCAVMFRKRSLRELASTMIKSNYKVYSFTNKEELILWLKK